MVNIIKTRVETHIKTNVIKISKLVKGIIISFCTMLVIYLGLSIYFSNHFYFGSEINGINVSGKTVEASR